MNNAPIYLEPPTFRNYEDFSLGTEYTKGWNDAMDAIFPEEAEKRRIEQMKKNLRIVPKERSRMSDRQKIMSDLEGLTFDDWHMFHCDSDVQGIAIDALKLLKEQEPKRVVITTNSYGTKFYHCPRCSHGLYTYPRQLYCSQCGQAVKWE